MFTLVWSFCFKYHTHTHTHLCIVGCGHWRKHAHWEIFISDFFSWNYYNQVVFFFKLLLCWKHCFFYYYYVSFRCTASFDICIHRRVVTATSLVTNPSLYSWPPSLTPLVSTNLFSVSMSLFLFYFACSYFACFRFHLWLKSHGICLSAMYLF